MLKVRALQHSDMMDVLRLNGAAAPAVFRLDVPELSRLMEISNLYLAAMRADNTMAGYALAFTKDHSYDGEEFLALRATIAGSFVYVDQIAVDESARGAGIGRMLYEVLASRGRDIGAAALCCEVNTSPTNPGSLAFHRSMGFAQVGEMDTQDNRTVALLLRKLA